MPAATATAPRVMASCFTLVDTASSRDDLTTLVDLLVSTGLADALTSPTDELTVLAPNNRAFETALAALGETGAEALLADPEALAQACRLPLLTKPR